MIQRLLTLGVALWVWTAAPAIAADARTCNAWDAVYAGQPDEDGAQVFASFGVAVGSSPVTFTLIARNKDGKNLWRHETHAWCFLGSGGCFVGIRSSQDELGAMDFAREFPITFVHSDKTNTEGTHDILVLGGLQRAFFRMSLAEGDHQFDIEKFTDAEEVPMPPDAFYFEKCRDQ